MRVTTAVLASLVGLLPQQVSAQTPILLLGHIANKVRNAQYEGKRPMVVFDIDGTLLDARRRVMYIIKEYAEQELEGVGPAVALKLARLEVKHVQLLLTDTLSAVGVNDSAVVGKIRSYVSQRMHTNDYLIRDTATAGSVRYVQELYSMGACIIYVSGRDTVSQLTGTVKALHQKGYPIGVHHTQLIMRPTAHSSYVNFLKQVKTYLRQFGDVIATFDSEPERANENRQTFPKTVVVLYEAVHLPHSPTLLPNIMPLPAFPTN